MISCDICVIRIKPGEEKVTETGLIVCGECMDQFLVKENT